MNSSMGTFPCMRMRCDIDHQFRNNLWCLFPRVHCGCGYRKLYDYSHEILTDIEQNTRIPFYIRDLQWMPLDVECDVAATTLCDILAKKNGKHEDPKWCIVEYIQDRNLRRVLEDHEHVLTSHEEFLNFSNGKGKLYFEYISNKELMFDLEKLIDLPYVWFKERSTESEYFLKHNKYCFVIQGDNSVTLVTECWYKIPDRKIWNKSFLLLQGGFVKLVNREIAYRIINKNIPQPLDVERQMRVEELDEAEFITQFQTRTSVHPFQWICKSSTSPMQSQPFIEEPKGLNGKEIKIYTQIEEVQEYQYPTNHVLVLVEKVLNKESSFSDTPIDETVVEDFLGIRSNDERSIDDENHVNCFPKPNMPNWTSNLKAKFIGKKKRRDENSELFSMSPSNPVADDKKNKTKSNDRKRSNNLAYVNVGAEESLYLENTYDNAGNKYKYMNVSFESDSLMRIWVDILRFTKYGDILKTSCRNFHDKQNNLELEEAKKNCTQEHNYFVNMDFTGPEGRIVEDDDPMPSSSKQEQKRNAHYSRWYEHCINQPFDSYETQLCKRPTNVSNSIEELNMIMEEEETYIDLHRPKGILKSQESTGIKKRVRINTNREVRYFSE